MNTTNTTNSEQVDVYLTRNCRLINLHFVSKFTWKFSDSKPRCRTFNFDETNVKLICDLDDRFFAVQGLIGILHKHHKNRFAFLGYPLNLKAFPHYYCTTSFNLSPFGPDPFNLNRLWINFNAHLF